MFQDLASCGEFIGASTITQAALTVAALKTINRSSCGAGWFNANCRSGDGDRSFSNDRATTNNNNSGQKQVARLGTLTRLREIDVDLKKRNYFIKASTYLAFVFSFRLILRETSQMIRRTLRDYQTLHIALPPPASPNF